MNAVRIKIMDSVIKNAGQESIYRMSAYLLESSIFRILCITVKCLI